MNNSDTSFSQMAAVAAGTLAKWHDRVAGTWPDGWWQSANALQAIIDYSALTGDESRHSLISLTFEQAQRLFEDMSLGWDDSTCGGGVWWTKEKGYKDAMPNELRLVNAAISVSS